MTELVSLRALHVLRRNYLVWRKLLVPSVMGNLADPLIWLLGFGIGFGALLPEVGGMSYLTFLGTGMICHTAMYSASFEALYSTFARLQIQRTWEGILYAPMTVRDVLLGEWMWAATKGFLSGLAILVVMYVLGLVEGLRPLIVLPVVVLIGLAFSGMALIMTALAKSYDFFVYYFTLLVTPMMLVSGVFFPRSALPQAVQAASSVLPLTHATELTRALALGNAAPRPLTNILVLAAYALASLALADVLVRRRLTK